MSFLLQICDEYMLVTEPFTESQFQLDTDYIQRYLGELSLLQESRLVQLRKWVADLQKGKVNQLSLFTSFNFVGFFSSLSSSTLPIQI
jgi:hypothetical protein